jgi:hypothetical protein
MDADLVLEGEPMDVSPPKVLLKTEILEPYIEFLLALGDNFYFYADLGTVLLGVATPKFLLFYCD